MRSALKRKRVTSRGRRVYVGSRREDWDVEVVVGPPMTEVELRLFRESAERLRLEAAARQAIESAHSEALWIKEERRLEASRMTVADLIKRLSGQDPGALVRMGSWDDDDGFVRRAGVDEDGTVCLLSDLPRNEP